MKRLASLLQDRIVVRLLSAVGLFVLAAQIFFWYPRYALEAPAPDDALDFLVYQRAAARAAQGLTPYESCARDRALPPHCLLYPPPFAAAIALGGHASPATFQKATYLLLLIAFWVYAAGLVRLALGRIAPGRRGLSQILIAGLVLFFTPGLNRTISFGNLDLVVWALVAWSLTDERALPLLVVAAGFKIWPAVPLAVLVIARPRRAGAVALTAACLLGLTVAVLGLSSFRDWAHWALPGLRAGTLVASNVSLVAILARMGFELPTALVALLPIAAAAATAIALRRQPERLRALGSGIAAMISAPIFWWIYAPVLLMPWAVWISGRADTKSEAAPIRTHA